MKSIILICACAVAMVLAADDVLDTRNARFGAIGKGDGTVGNATLVGSEDIGTDAGCITCSYPCHNYCCEVPPTLYCYYDGRCWCVS